MPLERIEILRQILLDSPVKRDWIKDVATQIDLLYSQPDEGTRLTTEAGLLTEAEVAKLVGYTKLSKQFRNQLFAIRDAQAALSAKVASRRELRRCFGSVTVAEQIKEWLIKKYDIDALFAREESHELVRDLELTQLEDDQTLPQNLYEGNEFQFYKYWLQGAKALINSGWRKVKIQ